MLPIKEDNIYPITKKNVNALLHYYFDIPFGDIDWIYSIETLRLNQIEWIAKNVAENIEFLNSEVGGSGNTVSNFMKYGIDACFQLKRTPKGSKNRIRITNELEGLISENND